MVGKEGNWVGMGVAAPGKIVILGLARVEYHEIAPGKRAFLYFARVEKGKTAPGKRQKKPSARGEYLEPTLAVRRNYHLLGTYAEKASINHRRHQSTIK